MAEEDDKGKSCEQCGAVEGGHSIACPTLVPTLREFLGSPPDPLPLPGFSVENRCKDCGGAKDLPGRVTKRGMRVVAHLNRDGTSLCGLPAEHLVRGLGVVEWRDLELRDPDAVFDLCQVCAKSYRATAAEDGRACTLCRGNIPRCPRCAGLGRYPKWAAEELEAGDVTDNRPTHNLCVKPEGEGPWSQIGIGWENDKGQITLRIYPCVVLDSDAMREGDLKLMLFVNKK